MFAYTVEIDREDDGRWIAEVLELPGVLAYGDSQQQAVARAEALALRVLADQIESRGHSDLAMSVTFAEAQA
jgi:predicted RNase H-like HicB family nuclease